jgi:hypothetical protein
MRITRRQANNINSGRDSILHHLGPLRAQENRARHPPPRARRSRLVVPSDEEEIACDYCESTQHLTTEYPTTPDIVYDQAETPPRARLPGERLDSPATWSTIHHATFHYLVTSVIQYYRLIHNSPDQRQTLLRQITTALDLNYPVELDSPLTPPSTLFDQAVNALVKSLRASPFPIRHENDPLLHTLCERYYSPIFGRSLAEYCDMVYTHYTQ